MTNPYEDLKRLQKSTKEIDRKKALLLKSHLDRFGDECWEEYLEGTSLASDYQDSIIDGNCSDSYDYFDI